MQPLSLCHAGLTPRLQPVPVGPRGSVVPRALAPPLPLAGSSSVPPAAMTYGGDAGNSFVALRGTRRLPRPRP